jgi:hypothetical protein
VPLSTVWWGKLASSQCGANPPTLSCLVNVDLQLLVVVAPFPVERCEWVARSCRPFNFRLMGWLSFTPSIKLSLSYPMEQKEQVARIADLSTSGW